MSIIGCYLFFESNTLILLFLFTRFTDSSHAFKAQ